MPYTEDELLPISAISQFVHCRRRCALIFIENQWADNVQTAEGTGLHDKVHDAGKESRGDVRKVTGLRLRSLQLGLSGVADVVEFYRIQSAGDGARDGVTLIGVPGRWTPLPVEYKRGKARIERCYEVQLCAQALCLEEMLNTNIKQGALYSGAKHHRRCIMFGDQLKEETIKISKELHVLCESGKTPPSEYGKKCNFCSLAEICQPQTGEKQSISRYIKRMTESSNEETT